ncbi:hypothetical protein [Halomonas halophila]|uniref:hypothetical protein n=1 Tax=Halomonas halophila TaxID=29573 RepID=UPI00363FD0A8
MSSRPGIVSMSWAPRARLAPSASLPQRHDAFHVPRRMTGATASAFSRGREGLRTTRP